MQDKFGSLWEEEEDSNDLSDYGSPQYWDDRYKESEKPFDWYFGWKRLSKEIEHHFSSSDEVLVLGCGNSEMSADMLDDGFPRITSIDISPSVIVQMKEKYADKKMGARPLKRAIQSVIEDALAEEILKGSVKQGDTVTAGYKDQKVTFTVKRQ